ncbi:hypothetical protein [Massilia sp. SYSU DXS3249]
MTKDLHTTVAIAPFERLVLPAHLDGSLVPHQYGYEGTAGIKARNDMDAIGMWLADVARTPATRKAYLLTAERCLLWATVELGKPMSALSQADAHTYGEFLLHLQPCERWLCPGRYRRADPAWRPFQARMSLRSRDGAIGILSTLWTWLQNRGYVYDNPWARTLCVRSAVEKNRIAPALGTNEHPDIATAVEWSYVRIALEEMEESQENLIAARVRAIFYLTYFADIKPGEISALRIASIREIATDPFPIWTLSLEGRSSATREIVLVPPAQRALQRYLTNCRITLPTDPGHTNQPLISSTRIWHDKICNLTRHALHLLARPLFDRAAAIAMINGDTLAARRLCHSSLQWLTHAFEVHLAQQRKNGNWAWLMLGSNFLCPPSMLPYLPRPPLEIHTILRAFSDLEDMWEANSA